MTFVSGHLYGKRFQKGQFSKEMHPQWKGGVKTCLFCEKVLGSRRAHGKDVLTCVAHKGKLKFGGSHHNWKGGISKDVHSTKEPKYKEWRTGVFSRDGFVCRVCGTKEKLQAHHILRWADFPEFRYDINNGITLCLAHHPRKMAEEKRLAPVFTGLVSVSKVSILK